jgi:hypothetical protein
MGLGALFEPSSGINYNFVAGCYAAASVIGLALAVASLHFKVSGGLRDRALARSGGGEARGGRLSAKHFSRPGLLL